MSLPDMPQAKPARPEFSSGPCPKRPGWSAEAVAARFHAGRSHRAAGAKAQIKGVIDKIANLLDVPSDFRVGIVPASDTGAYEMAMWSMLGARPVDMLVWESFGKGWATDATKQLKLDDCRVIEAEYGALPDLASVRPEADICFTQNGTTSGARIPNFDWIAADREGLTFVDATSAVFAQPVDWSKVDVLTFSFQKVLGGEGAHGVLILSPRAVERLETFDAGRPLPKIFRMTKGGKLIEGIFTGATINTPSMWAIADAEDALDWIGDMGPEAAMERAQDNYSALQYWVDDTDWVANLVDNPLERSNTSVCLKIVDPAVASLDDDAQKAFVKKMVKMLEAEEVAYDINGYRDAPAGLRIWCGATVDASDIRKLTPWLDWAFAKAKADL
ncbi:phosphoserine transaminase [Roseobacter sp. HKCCA0434]|uniref:phosphoserine transaminase n=1 Tax=Roseobacter sp. HKCCA0434 TaxID=3079297 RepID=UPI002905B05B|nr:phosphoserine transaminase [Roseobacter sp. HKCCA0434]